MAPSPSGEAGPRHAELLLDLAESALVDALGGRRPAPPPLADLPADLFRVAGAFVTLTVDGQLNGCVGSVDGDEPLAQVVPRLALAAAFADHRLPPLQPADYPGLTIEVSVLSPPEPIAADNWIDLHHQLRADHNGVIIRAGTGDGLFLPAVWAQLPDPADFLDQLYLKAGLSPRTWPPGMQAFRFTTECHRRTIEGNRPPTDQSPSITP